ncbi:nucleolar protein 14 homolog isoform X2 [Bacillus rossius redtenbacheri]|uniref:nucleolar protein 14 homolog isoform X2 n=1 Tax=Bacillus rossius redtenbacheri TaxID=93214 RepID=UPI002FDD9842
MTKKKVSDALNRKRVPKKKVLNPFEIHVNKQKFNVIGRKVKNEKGVPGVSRARAIKKRKATLLQEYRVKGKSNKFLDMRIGERNSAMTAEDKIVARFTAERMRSHKKNSIFNLADEEVLTHHGQTLNEIENFDDPRSDEEDMEDSGKLDAGFVGDAHFGGGVLTKTSGDGAASRKGLIDQLIAESKRRKAEQQRAREQTLGLTEKLDGEWKDLLPLVSASRKRPGDAPPAPDSLKPDAYDIVVRELKLEARGKPSDKLKTEDELAREERERLERLEAERRRRMQGVSEEPPTAAAPGGKHRSADDLDDGFELQPEVEPTLVYDDEGKLVGPARHLAMDDGPQRSAEVEVAAEETAESQQEDEDGDESGTEDEAADETESEEDSDNMSDLKGYDSDSEEEEEEEEEDAGDKDGGPKDAGAPPTTAVSREEEPAGAKGILPAEERPRPTAASRETKDADSLKADLLARKQLMDQARQELPYTFEVPDSYEGLQGLLAGRGPEHQAVIVERMVKCSHPSLAEGNKEKLGTLFAYLLQHLDDVATSQDGGPCCFAVLDRLAPHLYDVAQCDPRGALQCVLEVLKEKQHDFRRRPRAFPGVDTLVFLKVVSLLFPTSDFRHQAVTPALVFMEQMLRACRVRAERDVAAGLFVCTLMLEFTDLSRRFSPMSVVFLRRLLEMAIPDEGDDATTKKKKKKHTSPGLLVLSRDMSSEESLGEERMRTADLRGVAPGDDRFKVRALHTAARLLLALCPQLEGLPAAGEALGPCAAPLARLPLGRYPPAAAATARELAGALAGLAAARRRLLTLERTRPRALRLYEPSVRPVFDVKRHRPMGAARQEREKLVHKFKREMKGAVREIRRDRTFLAKLKLKETARSDEERLRKVREIFGSAAAQQSELKKLKRKK